MNALLFLIRRRPAVCACNVGNTNELIINGLIHRLPDWSQACMTSQTGVWRATVHELKQRKRSVIIFLNIAELFPLYTEA